MNEFLHPGCIVQFFNPNDGEMYDGLVWRVLPEDETNFSLVIRFVDTV